MPRTPNPALETLFPLLAGSSGRGSAARRSAVLGLALVVVALLGACGSDIEGRMSEARALQDVGQFAASIKELRGILAEAPENPEANYRLGVALMQTGEASRAVWVLEKAAQHKEFAVPAGLLLASSHFTSQNFEACIRAADRVLQLDSANQAARTMRAKGYLGAQRLEDALKDTEELRELAPEDYSILALHATVLGDLGRNEDAKAAYDALKEMGIASGDASLGPRGCIAPALFAKDTLKDAARAEELFDDCIERFPTNGIVIQQFTQFLDPLGKEEKATELVRAAAEKAPENLSLRSSLANRLRSQGDAAGAEKVLLEAVESFDSAGAWNLLAAFYREQHDSAKALEAIEKVVSLSGGANDQLRFTQADMLIDEGRLEEAEKIAVSLKEPVYTKLLQGRILLERGDAKGALENFEHGIRAWPSNAGARYLAGSAAFRLGDLDRAVSELREAVRVDNASTPAAELLTRIHFERGEYAEALRFAQVALKRRDANPIDIYAVIAKTLTALKKYDEARLAAKTLLGLPEGKLRGTHELALIAAEQEGPAAGSAAIEAGGFDLAAPENLVLLRAYSEFEIAAKRGDRALAKTEQALEKQPESADLHQIRGTLLAHLDRSDDARAAFERSQELAPDSGRPLAGLAMMAARSGDLKRAIELFDQASAKEPLVQSYRYSAAQLELALGNTAAAEKRLRELVASAPAHAAARNDLAWILADRGEELDYALQLAEEARRLDSSPEVLDTLGWVHFKRGEMAKSIEALEQSVAARGDVPSTRYRLGLALNKSGDPARAREMLESAIAAGEFPESADARRELQQLESE